MILNTSLNVKNLKKGIIQAHIQLLYGLITLRLPSFEWSAEQMARHHVDRKRGLQLTHRNMLHQTRDTQRMMPFVEVYIKLCHERHTTIFLVNLHMKAINHFLSVLQWTTIDHERLHMSRTRPAMNPPFPKLLRPPPQHAHAAVGIMIA